MKLLDWISRKPKQEEAATTNAADLLSHQQQQQQQVLKRSVHAVQSKLLKLNQNKAALQGGNKSDRDPADTKKRREIVKIFVNHEEYGLLAIGTLGLYDVSGVEPEIELFEVKPNLLFQPDDDNKDQNEKKQHKNEEEEQQRRKKDEGSLVLCKPEKKKVFSLDPSSLIGTKLLKRSNKLLDRILHPLNHFSFTSSSSISASTREREEDHLQDKQSSKSLSLFKKLVLSGNSAKQITGSTGNSSENSGSAIETRARSHHHRNHRSNSGSSSSSITNTLKRRSTAAFSCMSVQVEDDESEPESESEAETDNGSLRGDTTWSSSSLSSRSSSLSSSSPSLSSSTSTTTSSCSSSSVVTSHSSSSSECPAACSAPGDPKPGHQQADAKDIKPEYWIRTDSDYVVLEL